MTVERATSPSLAAAERQRDMLIALLALATVARIWLGWSEVGLYWPDEIYQSLEPAHRLAFGYGLRAWEYIDGARNWTFPALISVVLSLASVFGADAPDRYLWLLRMLFSGLGVFAAWGTYRLAIIYKAPPDLALAGAALFAFNAVSLYFSHRAMAEVASMPLIAWGFVLLLEERPTRNRLWLIVGASMLGLSVLIRLQNGLFCVGALGVLLGRSRWRDGVVAFGVLCGWAFALGLIDKLTWGGWFHSAFKYIQFNVVEGKAAAGWGAAPFSYYGWVAWTAMQGPALVLALATPFALRRATGPTLTCLAFVLLLGLTPHKEFRFIIPALPLMFAMAVVGVDLVADLLTARVLKSVPSMALVIIALHSGSRAPGLTFGELGAYEDRPRVSAWGDSAAVNRLLLAAHHQPDVCGLKVEAVPMAWAGGQSYFHRPVNLYAQHGPPREAGVFNYVITALEGVAGAEIVTADGSLVLARLPNVRCRDDPNYQASL